jgi:hypothetical protein
VNDLAPGGKAAKGAVLKAVRAEIANRLRIALDGKTIEVLINDEEPAATDLDAVTQCERWARESHTWCS